MAILYWIFQLKSPTPYMEEEEDTPSLESCQNIYKSINNDQKNLYKQIKSTGKLIYEGRLKSLSKELIFMHDF